MSASPASLVNANTPGAPSFFPLSDPAPGTALPAADWPQNETLPLLFTPITVGGMAFKNRLWTGPMCQYSAGTVDGERGHLSKWHEIHLGGIAARGTGLLMIEATAVMENGGITPECPGLWSDKQGKRLAEVVQITKALGAKTGIQLAHAGRKASTVAPWIGGSTIKPGLRSQIAHPEANGWKNVWGPSEIAFAEGYAVPKAMTLDEIEELKQAWVSATRRADEAGIDVVELHFAHGYLVQSFLSPLSNHRTDKYGGSIENRMRLALEIVDLVRATLSKDKPLFARISAVEWHPEGEQDANCTYISWGIEQSKLFLQELIKRGVALVDVSSGGNDVRQAITVGPDYQVQFARALKQSMKDDARIPISAVGLITSGTHAEDVLQSGSADVVTIARELLRNQDAVFDWAQELQCVVNVPVQYQWAYRRMMRKPAAVKQVDSSAPDLD